MRRYIVLDCGIPQQRVGRKFLMNADERSHDNLRGRKLSAASSFKSVQAARDAITRDMNARGRHSAHWDDYAIVAVEV